VSGYILAMSEHSLVEARNQLPAFCLNDAQRLRQFSDGF
jgi:hypothetical protein